MEKYVNIVGAVEMGTSIIMVCFLLYLGSETKSFNPFFIGAAAIYQTAVFCVLGEQFSTEVSQIIK